MANFLVHQRLLMQRGISFVAIFVASLTAVGVWRSALPGIHWGWLLLIGGVSYLAVAWVIGWFDERYLWRIETSKYSQRNPELMEILTIVKEIKEKLDNANHQVP